MTKGTEGKLKKIEDDSTRKKIHSGIENMTINATNYDATIRKIETLIGE